MCWAKRGRMALIGAAAGAAAFYSIFIVSKAAADEQPSAVHCSFEAAPDRFLAQQARVRDETGQRVLKFSRLAARDSSRATVSPADIPRKNFIDEEIFGAMQAAGIRSAPLTTDDEFLRRVYLDLTGRIPTIEEFWAFKEDRSANKRDELIDRLLNSPDFTERWTMWLGDLLQNTLSASNVTRGADARNAYHIWIRRAVGYNMSLREVAWHCVTSSGSSFDEATGAANFAVNAQTPMGPVQDTFDTMLYKTASTFLGLGHYDCLLCHNGRGHLDQLSLWGKQSTRLEAQKMAAFFSRMRLTRTSADSQNLLRVVDQVSGQYDLNTSFGNRPNRTPIGTLRSVTPEYRETRAVPNDGNWRQAFAEFMINDPMFARNLANRLWKQIFNLGLVEPVDGLDPARLDPKDPPPSPWTLQASHPALLEKLAQAMRDQDYSLREFLRLLVRSSAYQLSAVYGDEWTVEYVPYFARRYPRRLEGEEIHDIILQATGMAVAYTVQGYDTVSSAIRLPEPVEPRSNGSAAAFMNYFYRGNRDTQQRSQSGSVLQQLALMNDNFIVGKLRVGTSPALTDVSRITNNDEVIDHIYVRFLARHATASERQKALELLSKAANAQARNTAIEDLAWVCVNKIDFLFSY